MAKSAAVLTVWPVGGGGGGALDEHPESLNLTDI